MKGFAFSLQLDTNCSILAIGSLTLRNDQRRMALWVMSENHRSTW
jgi:hypothetical protein